MWPQIANVVLGLWLMVSPVILNYGYPAIQNDRVIGPLAAAVAAIAAWEVTRPLRWVNLLIGVYLLAAPFMLAYDQTRAILNSVLIGAAMIVFAQMGGQVTERFGGGWAALLPDDDVADEPVNEDDLAKMQHG